MTRPRTLVEKILAHHAMGDTEVVPGKMICVKVDWTMASEASWFGMYRLYDQLGRPGIYRNDRVWLAADHIVDPRINHLPKPKALIDAAESGAKELDIKDYQPPNTTIMHTEFYRQRAQPGMLIIGADSHTCSSGALGALAVGLGAADVVFPLVTGETFFQVPEVVRIELVGKPNFGIGGKDIILHILGEFKRNTIAAGRAVEYVGDGIHYLSCDARFAIANMSTEFGAIAGVFVPDQQTAAFINQRSSHKDEAIYFQPDPEAQYVETRTINLQDVGSYIALYPSPDNVVPVSEKQGMKLDGCFIGACTTAEEDLIMGGLVLQQGLKKGLKIVSKGKRKVTPGSIQIIAKLRSLGLLQCYIDAGFEVGAPGCSYCVGMGADQAGEGEVWLSSQNRNFKNRMGKGSIGNISSAATVAASSFSMTLKDPQELLNDIDESYFNSIRMYWTEERKSIIYREPKQDFSATSVTMAYEEEVSVLPTSIISRAQVFGDNIDTDAIIPIDKCTAENETLLGQGSFAYTRPEFVPRVAEGYGIIVAGNGFGSGSSREEAPRALKACGVKAVIAKSFAYIYSRNQANFALFGVIVTDDNFYNSVSEGSEIEIKVAERKVHMDGKSYPFKLDVVEERLQASGGIAPRWKRHGKNLFRKLQQESNSMSCGSDANNATCSNDDITAW